MELDDFKAVWAKEQKELENRLVLNEALVRQMTFEKSKDKFNELLNLSIMGRNMALVYMAISVAFAAATASAVAYSIPAAVGGLAMLFSFMQHWKLKLPDFSKMSSLELQKAITEFKIYTSQHAKYDFSIVAFWLITLIPAFLKVVLKLAIYNTLNHTLLYAAIVLLAVLAMLFFVKKLYKKIDSELDASHAQLDAIKQFEQF